MIGELNERALAQAAEHKRGNPQVLREAGRLSVCWGIMTGQAAAVERCQRHARYMSYDKQLLSQFPQQGMVNIKGRPEFCHL